MGINLKEYIEENSKVEENITNVYVDKTSVTNNIIIVPKENDCQALKECMRQFVYCSAIMNKILLFDPEKYIEYMADDDVELYRKSLSEKSLNFIYPVQTPTQLREYFDKTAIQSLDNFWKMFKEHLLSNQKKVDNHFNANDTIQRNLNMTNTTILALRPSLDIIGDDGKNKLDKENIYRSSYTVDSYYRTLYDGDIRCINISYDCYSNEGIKLLKELSKAYPELEFQMVEKVSNPTSYNVEKEVNACYASSKYMSQRVSDIREIVCGCYILRAGNIIKSITSADIELDESTVYPKALIWDSIISNYKFYKCLNPKCTAIFKHVYGDSCPACNKRKFGRTEFKGLHPIIPKEFPLLCRITCTDSDIEKYK